MARGTRREFIQHTFLGFGTYLAVGVGASCRRGSGSQTADSGPVVSVRSPEFQAAAATGAGLFFLNAAQFLTTAAACECILPADEDPGAIDLGVPFYVDRTLANEDLEDWRKPFVGGLSVLDRQCTRMHKALFHECTLEQQSELLARWQKGKSGETRFFQVLMNLTFEGAFGDPIHGGNKDGKGFEMAGFIPGPPMPAPDLVKVGRGGHSNHGGG